MADPTRTLMLVRSRQGVDRAGRVVHLAPLTVGVEAICRAFGACCTVTARSHSRSPSPATYRAWGWPAPVLVDPGDPGEQVLLAREPYGVALPWPGRVRLLTGALPLPPSVTPGGPVRWRQRPVTADPAGCREIEVFSAVRTVLRAEHAWGGFG